MYSVYKLFSVPIMKFKFSKHDEYYFENIEKHERIPENWRCSINSSYPKTLNNDIFIDKKKNNSLQKDLLIDIKEMFRQANIPTNISFNDMFWYNISHEEQFQERHNHYNFFHAQNLWSGIYYNKNATPTTFYPYSHFHRITKFKDFEKSIISDCYYDFFNVDVEDGDVVIFPSTIDHEVRASNRDIMRLTFSFNITII